MSQPPLEGSPQGDASPWRLPASPYVLVLIGASGSGKSTWAHEELPWLRALSSDELRAVLTDDENHQGCSAEVFEQLERLAKLRLSYGRAVVIDATHTHEQARRRWLTLAHQAKVPAFALWFDASMPVCQARQQRRARRVPDHAIRRQLEELGSSQEAERRLLAEPWDQLARVQVSEHTRSAPQTLRGWSPPLTSRVDEHGVFIHRERLDLVGDVHGCLMELEALMLELGWRREPSWHHPEQRLLVFVGDLVDRGPDSVGVMRLVAQLVEQQQAVLILGNHDDKVRRLMSGHAVKLDSHTQTTADELAALPAPERQALQSRAIALFEGAPLWALASPAPSPGPLGLGAQLAIAHAAWKPSLIGQKRDKVRWYCLYGPSTGKTDAYGLPERLDWKPRYPAQAPLCVVGHTPFDGPIVERHGTICLDTACVFGHRLSALRHPEGQIVSVPAQQRWSTHACPIEAAPRFAPDPRHAQP